MMRFLLTLSLLSLSILSHSQSGVTLEVKINNWKSGKKLQGAEVILYSNGTFIRKSQVDKRGELELLIGYNQQYEVVFKKVGFVSKRVKVDTRNVPPKEMKNGGFIIPMEIPLFEELEGLDLSIFEKAIGVFKFNRGLGQFEVDRHHQLAIKGKIKNLMVEVEKAHQTKKG